MVKKRKKTRLEDYPRAKWWCLPRAVRRQHFITIKLIEWAMTQGRRNAGEWRFANVGEYWLGTAFWDKTEQVPA